MNSMWKSICNDLWEWLVINLFLPVLLPLFFAIMASGFSLNTGNLLKDFWNPLIALNFLFEKGIFVFLGITLLLNLYQDYRNARHIFNRKFFITTIVCLIVSGFIFINHIFEDSSLKNIAPPEQGWFAGTLIHIAILSVSILMAIHYKVRILILLYKRNHYGS